MHAGDAGQGACLAHADIRSHREHARREPRAGVRLAVEGFDLGQVGRPEAVGVRAVEQVGANEAELEMRLGVDDPIARAGDAYEGRRQVRVDPIRKGRQQRREQERRRLRPVVGDE